MIATQMTLVERMIGAARAATRCRAAAARSDSRTGSSLMRAADRYSRQIAELAAEMLQEGRAQ